MRVSSKELFSTLKNNRYGVGSLPRYKYTYMYQYAQPRLDSSEHV